MNILTNTGPIGATGVMWSGKVDDLSTMLVKVNAIVGSTITVEYSADNSSWSTVPFGQDVTSGTPVNNAGSITTVGRFVFPTKNGAYFRVRVSTYVGPGNVDVEVDYSVQRLDSLVRPLDTSITAIGSTQATAYPVQAPYARFGTVAASTGAILPPNVGRNSEVVIRNAGANALSVYPPVGGTINGGSVNAASSHASGAVVRYVSDGAGNYWAF